MEESESGDSMTIQRRVGLLYDERMCKHNTPDDDYHPENPNRIKTIWNKLVANNIPQRAEFWLIFCLKFHACYVLLSVAERVAKGELHSAAAIVRPPGHHAEHDEAMGFCLFNNVAVATSFLLDERPELGIKKILIVDWDVHHGNGTQKMFWKDPRVLFFSVHRHEFGSFYPANDDGLYTMIGQGPGAGYNINVPWEHGRCGDADYLAVWDQILIPVAKEFDPDMIIVSAGFDAAVGDPLGGCRVTPYGYSVLLKKLMDFAHGKIVLALEGGYNLDSVANSFLACMEVLLESKPIAGSSEAYPFESTWRVIQAVRKKLSAYWPTLADEIPLKLTSHKAPPPHLLISSSDSEDEVDKTPNIVSDNMVAVVQEITEPLSKLKVEDSHDQAAAKSVPWRSELSKTDIWHATFGLNMWKRRFLCYIQGGQVDGMGKRCSGSMDKNPPKEILWKTFSHRLFFGHESTRTWGSGGVAFLHPESSVDENTYMCMYQITLEQFNDVLFQENVSSNEMDSPAFDLADLQSVTNQGSVSLEVFKKQWYHNVVYLGKEKDIPILTITCSLSDVESFKSKKLPLCAPCNEYANTLIQGLVEGGQLSEEEASAYIKAASKPL
ncbi:histone deacetylase 5 isoform X2 [Hevea brasiliensis]|uniref:histone deacetylase 5 isoform X2 n=1 Tax=Hevea brasiliensis TaxID=3981 RepID=UPI0025DD3E66|nr:histone deacetylase 5 isoform X2 [Hevea brasiliensis]